jgi:hypothetical protein
MKKAKKCASARVIIAAASMIGAQLEPACCGQARDG